MNICMILDSYFPPDIRVEKEARALISEGHRIFLCSLGKKGVQALEDVNGITVIRSFPSDKFLFRAWRFLWFNMFFYSFLWKKTLEDVITRYEIEAIHVHDLPLVKTATSVAKKFGIPVISDLHENYPENMRAWRVGKITLKRRIISLISPIWRYQKLEKSVLPYVDRIITVVDEARNHYINDCGVSLEEITVVMNVEDLEYFGNLKIDEFLITKYKNDFVISYIGGFGPHRGIDTLIKSMPKVLEEIPDAKLLLVGGTDLKEYEEELRRMCKDEKVEDNVVFTGRVDFSLVPSYIASSEVCLVPHHSSGHTNTTIPHKLFQYMAMRKPVIVTDCKPLKRIVEECNCGIVVPSGDCDKLSEAVIKLCKDRELASKLGENGRMCVEKGYNWTNEAQKLIMLYKELENGRSNTINRLARKQDKLWPLQYK
jgi:glycosyltransferase involved in cell wall biosynthesis